MDGINGFAGIQALLALIALSLLSYSFSEIYLVLAVLVLAFLGFNFPNAKMFMGDSGSYFLGIFLSTAIAYHTFLTDTNIFFAINCLLIVFWIDPFITLIMRLANSENILLAHNQHLYQKITRLTGSHSKTVLLFLSFLFWCWYLSLICAIASSPATVQLYFYCFACW